MVLTDTEKELIGALKNEMNHLWAGAFIVGGGGINLAIAYPSPLSLGLGTAGLFGAIVLLYAYLVRHLQLKNMLLEGEKHVQK